MDTQGLRCHSCGAPAGPDTRQCSHCGVRLATVACPSCFGMLFVGTPYCPHCGVRADRGREVEATHHCPRCRKDLVSLRIGNTPVHECLGCRGLWLDAASFQEICSNHEEQGAILGNTNLPGGQIPGAPVPLQPIKYLPCAVCGTLMHRVNFANVSGVIVDSCRGHGTWFDEQELHKIVHFIRSGGVEVARKREMAQLESERRRLELSKRMAGAFDGRGGADAGPGGRGFLAVDGMDLIDLVAGLGRFFRG